MVDEQFPLQRKILKGQVDVRNEETSIYARSEKNSNGVNSKLVFLLSCVCYMADEVCIHPDKVKQLDAP